MAEENTARFKGPNLTAELVACVERFEPDPGPEPGTSEYTQIQSLVAQEIEASSSAAKKTWSRFGENCRWGTEIFIWQCDQRI